MLLYLVSSDGGRSSRCNKILFGTAPPSRIKAYFSLGWYGLFLICGDRKKMVRHICELFYKISWLFHCILWLNMKMLHILVFWRCWCELVHLVPMLTVDCLCYSLLQIGLFIDVFPFFPRPLLGLAALIWALGLGSPSPHTLLQVIIMCMFNRQYKFVCVWITLAYLLTRVRWTCCSWILLLKQIRLALLLPYSKSNSRRNTSVYMIKKLHYQPSFSSKNVFPCYRRLARN